jgi:hypothetical protein
MSRIKMLIIFFVALLCTACGDTISGKEPSHAIVSNPPETIAPNETSEVPPEYADIQFKKLFFRIPQAEEEMRAQSYADVENYWRQLTDAKDASNGWIVELKFTDESRDYLYYDADTLTKEMLLQKAADETIKALCVSESGTVDYSKIRFEVMDRDFQIDTVTSDREIEDAIAQMREHNRESNRIIVSTYVDDAYKHSDALFFESSTVSEMVAKIKEMTRLPKTTAVNVILPVMFVAT